MNKYKISIYSLISCALFFAVFKPYFLPDAIRQGVKNNNTGWCFHICYYKHET